MNATAIIIFIAIFYIALFVWVIRLLNARHEEIVNEHRERYQDLARKYRGQILLQEQKYVSNHLLLEAMDSMVVMREVEGALINSIYRTLVDKVTVERTEDIPTESAVFTARLRLSDLIPEDSDGDG